MVISLRNGVPPPKEEVTAREEASEASRGEGRAASHHRRHGRHERHERHERREERREEERKEE